MNVNDIVEHDAMVKEATLEFGNKLLEDRFPSQTASASQQSVVNIADTQGSDGSCLVIIIAMTVGP